MTPPTPTEAEIARIVGSLTEAQRAMLSVCPFWGVRPGDNMHPLLAIKNPNKPGHILCEGEDVEVGFRLGLLNAEHRPGKGQVLHHSEHGEVICDWGIRLTPLGAAVRSAIEDSKGETR
jgi:hypothetical protein